MRKVKHRLKATDTLTLILFSDHPRESRRFLDDLARELDAAPKDLIAGVEYRIDRELAWFERRKALYVDLADLRKIRDTIEKRIEYEQELYNPLNIFSETEIPEPRLDLRFLKRAYDSRIAAYTRFPSGYYATADERVRVMLIYKAGSSTEIDRLRLLKGIVDDSIRKIDPSKYAPDIRIHFTGDVQNMIEEQAAILEDLEISTAIVGIAVVAALLLFFRSWIATFALIASVQMGTLWTMGAAYFLVGSLNANSAFLASIVVGNGINFGIILTARYLEERRMGVDAPLSLRMAMIRSAGATWTAALAAGLSYGSLMLTGFRGFRQFGIIGLTGMVLCWISSFTVLPALLQLLMNRREVRGVATPENLRSLPAADPAGEIPSATGAPAFRSYFFAYLVKGLARFPVPILLLSLAVTGWSVFELTRVRPDLLETDLTRLRSRESLEHGSAFYADQVDKVFQRYLSPVAILAQRDEDTQRIADRLREIRRSIGPSSMIDSVQTLQDFVPRDQPEKIRLLREIRTLLPRRIVRQLPPREQAMARSFLSPESLRPIQLRDLPPLLLDRFRESDGSLGRVVLVTPPITTDIRERENLFRFVRYLRESADAIRPGTPVAGTLPVTADMFESVLRDGPKATLLAFLSVVVLVTLLFRDLRRTLLVLFTLFVGVLWLCGVALLAGIKINFLNFIALPITFGIGVDYGVNIVSRYVQEGRGSIRRVIGSTGAAVGLCSLTTIIGYSSLLAAKNLAFFSFGLLAVLGELTSICAGLAVIPALLELRDRRHVRPHSIPAPGESSKKAA